MLNKNQIIELEIIDITSDSQGVGKYEGMAVFVPFTAIGDFISCKLVKINKNYAFGIIDRIIKPSKDRILPKCSAFGKCGGCDFQHISYDAEILIKENFVKSAFTRIGKLNPEFLPIIGSAKSEQYRNKAQYPVTQADEAYYGFYANRSHRIVKSDACILQPEIFTQICDFVINYLNENKIPVYDEKSHTGILRHIYLRKGHYSGEICLCLVVKNKTDKFNKLCAIIVEKFNQIKSIVLNINSEKTNVILGDKNVVIHGEAVIKDKICEAIVQISPHSFYQVNTEMAEKLYNIAGEFAELNDNSVLLDLYCGIGTIGLSLAKRVKKVIGVEIVEQAVSDARINAELNAFQNMQFFCCDVIDLNKKLENNKPNAVILDPPRKGCDAQMLKYIADLNIENIVMISCNPATAARDCALLRGYGYETVKVQSVDMFPRTGHVETVVLMSRVKN